MSPVRILIVLFCIVTSTLSFAEVVFQQNGVAIKGFDPVSYHTMQQAVKGNAQYAVEWKGVNWHFSSQENKGLFSGNPGKYAPEYGGFCAYAASKGSLAPVDPFAWTVRSDKLYLNYSMSVRDLWRKDIEGNIKKADFNWPELNK